MTSFMHDSRALAETCVRVARSRAGAATFEVGRAEDLGAFADASFDAVCMSSVLHWVADKPKALAEVRRVLRPGGRFGVTTQPHELSGASTIGLVLAALLARAPYAGRRRVMEASSFGTFLRPVPDDLRPSLRADLIASFDARRGSEGVALRGWGLLFVATRPGKEGDR